MKRDIPGFLDLDALAKLSGFDARAQQHRPTDPVALRAEIVRLFGTGLKPADIAQALRLNMGQVLDALQEPA